MNEPLTLASLPLFPLGTVLYPGGLLPLRIFEVRYLDMIGKCHKLGAPFGVVALTEGAEVQRPAANGPSGDAFANEAFDTVGTLARITEFSVPQAGLMVIRCTGVQRFSITRSEKLKHGLWVADVMHLEPDQSIAVPPDLRPVSDALSRLIQSLLERGLAQDQMPIHAPYLLGDSGWVANRWCELLTLPLALKQRLMALDNPLVRLELVGDLLERNGVTR
ncbi:MAG: LON peptidase substrate-binding domain-containing protein [Burkholderiaceae bacterium]